MGGGGARQMNFEEAGYEDMEWIHLAQCRV